MEQFILVETENLLRNIYGVDSDLLYKFKKEVIPFIVENLLPFRIYSHLLFCNRDEFNQRCLCNGPVLSHCDKVFRLMRNSSIHNADCRYFSGFFMDSYLGYQILLGHCFYFWPNETVTSSENYRFLHLSVVCKVVMNCLDNQVYPLVFLPIKIKILTFKI